MNQKWAKNIGRKIILSGDQLALILVIIIVCIIFGILSPYFFTFINFMNILRQASYSAIAAVGVAITIIGGGVDLSIGSMQGFVGTIVVLILVYTNNLAIAIITGIAIGIIIGLLNGFVITKLGVLDIIATLAMFFSIRGAAYLLTNAASVANTSNSTFFNWIGAGSILGVPTPIIWTSIIYIFFILMLKFTQFGKYIHAIGANKEVAILNGIKFNKIKVLSYIISGITAAIAAIILAARMNSGQPNAGIGFEFMVVSAVIIGGCSLSGGRGSLVGVILGTIFLTILRNGFVLLDVSSFYQQLATGLILIAAVAIDYRRQLVIKNF